MNVYPDAPLVAADGDSEGNFLVRAERFLFQHVFERLENRTARDKGLQVFFTVNQSNDAVAVFLNDSPQYLGMAGSTPDDRFFHYCAFLPM